MKILFIAHGADMMGANRCLLDLINGLDTYDIDPLVLVPESGDLTKEMKRQQIKFLISKYHNWSFTKYINPSYWLHPLRAFQNQQYLAGLKALVEAENVDLIYTNSSQTGIGAFIADGLQIPHVWHIREFGEKDYNHSYWRGRSYFRTWANKAAAVISMSQAIHDEVLPKVTAPCYVIHDGIIKAEKLAEIPLRKAPAKPPFTFLIIGAIHPTKGQLKAVKAFHKVSEKHPNTQLWIVGKGRRFYTKKIATYIQKNGLEKQVLLKGYVNNPYEVHQQADAVLMCSKSEGMGRVTLEAMIFSNPVIGFNGGGTPELITNGKDGFIYEKGIDELAEYMDQLVSNPTLAFEMGKEGRKKIEAAYTIETFVEKIYKIMESVIEQSQRSA